MIEACHEHMLEGHRERRKWMLVIEALCGWCAKCTGQRLECLSEKRKFYIVVEEEVHFWSGGWSSPNHPPEDPEATGRRRGSGGSSLCLKGPQCSTPRLIDFLDKRLPLPEVLTQTVQALVTYCITIYPKTYGLNQLQHLIFPEPIIWALGMSWLHLASDGAPKAGGWIHVKVLSPCSSSILVPLPFALLPLASSSLVFSGWCPLLAKTSPGLSAGIPSSVRSVSGASSSHGAGLYHEPPKT